MPAIRATFRELRIKTERLEDKRDVTRHDDIGNNQINRLNTLVFVDIYCMGLVDQFFDDNRYNTRGHPVDISLVIKVTL